MRSARWLVSSVPTLALCAAMPAAAVDEFQLEQLRQDVAALANQVRQQALTIERLERELRAIADPAGRLNRQALEVERLERELSLQSLELRTRHAGRDALPAAVSDTASPPAWLAAANWERLRPGMSPLEVIEILGPPVTTRAANDGNGRNMFYSLELGPSAFLSGTVHIVDERVAAVEKPVLK